MIKALLWKEWREQRGIAFAGAAVALMIPLITIAVASASGAPDFLDVADVVPFLFAVVVWPLFAAMAGATVNSESGSLASSGFLFSRPVPRSLLWLIKVSIGVVAITFVVSVSYYAALRVDVWVGGWGFRFPFSSDPFSWPPDRAVRAIAVGVLYVSFCGAIFLSTFLRRSVAAAMGGLGLAVASQSGAIFMAAWIGGLGAGVEAFFEVYSLCLAGVLLLASLYVFRRAGFSGTDDARRSARRAWAGVGMSLPLIVVLAGFTSTRIVADTARVRFVMTVPGTDVSILSLSGNDFTGNSLWAAEPGRTMRPLTARLASAVAASPTGEWLVYSSQLSSFGTQASCCELHAVRIDGSEERILAGGGEVGPELWQYYAGRFSPDGTRVALQVSGREAPNSLLLTDINDGAPRYIDVSGLVPDGTHWNFVPEWISDDAVLLYDVYSSRSQGGVWRVVVDTGAIESVYAPPEGMSFGRLASSTTRMLIREREPRDYIGRMLDDSPLDEATKLVEIADGSVREVAALCPPESETETIATMTADGEHVFFVCRISPPWGDEWHYIDPDDLFRGALWRRNLSTGEEALIADFDGYVNSINASPDGSRLMVGLRDRPDDVPTLKPGLRYGYRTWRSLTFRYELVGSDGSRRPLDIKPDWSFRGWFGNDRLVLLEPAPGYSYDSRSIAYLELHANAVEVRPLHQVEGNRP